MVEFHHPGVLFRSNKLATTISVDIIGKVHLFTFAPFATITDLRTQVNSKFKITSILVIMLW